MKNQLSMLSAFAIVGSLVLSCNKEFSEPIGPDREHIVEPLGKQMSLVADGLKGPIGMALDSKHNLWVTTSGTGHNDAQLIMIDQKGQQFVVVDHFPSALTPPEFIPLGLTHIIIRHKVAWMLSLTGHLYRVDIGTYKQGDPPIEASTIHKEDIGAFVRDHDFVRDLEFSNPYNLTFGPDGALYIADAGANAIIRRGINGTLSVVAELPAFPNPTPVGPPFIDPVPTGIIWDNKNNIFLISTLTGFPYLVGRSNVWQLKMNGALSVYQSGFSTCTNIKHNRIGKILVLQYGIYDLAQRWLPESGQVLKLENGSTEVVLDKLYTPTSLVNANDRYYYVNSQTKGTIHKVRIKD